MKRIVVVGGSLAGHQSAMSLRELGYDGELTLYGAEPHRPYDRYPLSKAFLSGDLDRGGLDIEPADLDIDWRLGQTVTGLDLAGRFATVDGVDRAPFDGLVVATGSRPRLPCPVPREATGVFVVRTIEDTLALRAALTAGRRRVVVVGGGLIGAEVASTATEGGHHTTLVDSSPLPTSRALGPRLAEHLRSLHLAHGVRLVPSTRVNGFDVQAGRVRGAHFDDGRRLEADVVVLATGTQPNVGWLEGSGLTVSEGLSCRATLHATGCDIVVGAGDVVRAPHPALDGESVRVEHWASTRHQARVAATNLLAGPSQARSQSELPTFGTTIHGAGMRVIGWPAKADRSEVAWGSIADGEAIVAMYRRGHLIAAGALNATDRLSLLDDRWPAVPTEATVTPDAPYAEASR